MDIVVRQLEVRDIQAVRRITWETWLATYASYIPEADLRAFFDERYNIAALTELFKNPSITGYLIEVDKAVVGFSRTEYRKDENRFYISSLYILPSYQGSGLGRKLLEIAESQARRHGLDRIWLEVMAENITALSWYAKLGFNFIEEVPVMVGKTRIIHRIGYRHLEHDPASYIEGDGNNEQ